jgi:hypothetical protein
MRFLQEIQKLFAMQLLHCSIEQRDMAGLAKRISPSSLTTRMPSAD